MPSPLQAGVERVEEHPMGRDTNKITSEKDRKMERLDIMHLDNNRLLASPAISFCPGMDSGAI